MTRTTQNQMEKNMDIEMETSILGFRVKAYYPSSGESNGKSDGR